MCSDCYRSFLEAVTCVLAVPLALSGGIYLLASAQQSSRSPSGLGFIASACDRRPDGGSHGVIYLGEAASPGSAERFEAA